MYPGDVGTAGGVVTDEHARVLREDGSVIQGLYATGNCTASVVGRCYPGAGASIGASFIFGYIAAHHALGAGLQCTSMQELVPQWESTMIPHESASSRTGHPGRHLPPHGAIQRTTIASAR